MLIERARAEHGNEFRVEVRKIELLTPGVKTFELISSTGGQLPAFTPGAHIDVVVGDGSTRSYSLLNPLGDASHYCIASESRQAVVAPSGCTKWLRWGTRCAFARRAITFH
jgi:vanillate O-demethylase ferredoxin subunit